jgi:hypothetical protein
MDDNVKQNMDMFSKFSMPLIKTRYQNIILTKHFKVGDIVNTLYHPGLFEITNLFNKPDNNPDGLINREYVDLKSLTTGEIATYQDLDHLRIATPDEIVKWRLGNG